MTTTSVIMMIVAILVVWGGLVASILWLRSRPEVDLLEDPDLVRDDETREHLPRPMRDT